MDRSTVEAAAGDKPRKKRYHYTCVVCGAHHRSARPETLYCPPEPGQEYSGCQRLAYRKRHKAREEAKRHEAQQWAARISEATRQAEEEQRKQAAQQRRLAEREKQAQQAAASKLQAEADRQADILARTIVTPCQCGGAAWIIKPPGLISNLAGKQATKVCVKCGARSPSEVWPMDICLHGNDEKQLDRYGNQRCPICLKVLKYEALQQRLAILK